MAAAFLPEPQSGGGGGGEMRGASTGVALLASVLWVTAQCQQRGEPRSPVPLPGGRCGTKPHVLPLPRLLSASAFTSGWRIRHVGFPRDPWKASLLPGGGGLGGAGSDPGSLLIRAFGRRLFGLWESTLGLLRPRSAAGKSGAGVAGLGSRGSCRPRRGPWLSVLRPWRAGRAAGGGAGLLVARGE